jgi:hypothetical protein
MVRELICDLRMKVLSLFPMAPSRYRLGANSQQTIVLFHVVCIRMDFREWLAMMPCWKSRLARSLAMGNRTKEVAKRFRVGLLPTI